MATPEEQITRYRAAFAAAKTPRVVPHRGSFSFQYEPHGPTQLFSAKQFEEMIAHLEGRAPLLDNGVSLMALEDEDSGGTPPPPEPHP